MIRTLPVELGDRSYPIHIGPGLIDQAERFVEHLPGKQVLIVTNTVVAPLYEQRVRQSLTGRVIETVVLPDGEEFKSLASAERIWNALLAARFSRNCSVVALGGGVIGDLAGFAAACYQRGVGFLQVPTTLLAQVDSSVGGKTAVNHPLGKNMIGAFYQPRCVLADTATLASLDARQFSAGLAEVVKYGLIRDLPFFEWLEAHLDGLLARDPAALIYAIERSCINKAEVVAADEREGGVRATLNLGHTFGHAIEVGAGYGEYLHGEAVAIGMGLAADLSQRLGWLARSDVERIRAFLRRARLPDVPPPHLQADDFLEHMAVDKKNVDGELRLILLEGMGRASLPTAVPREQLLGTLREYGRA